MHLCCGPCSIYPLQRLRKEGHEVSGLFYNPNIHPYKEFRRRIEAVEQLSRTESFTVAIDRDYGLQPFLRQVVFHERERCPLCYTMRLEHTAQQAREQGIDAFTTTLLYSKYQNHELIIQESQRLADQYGVAFFYEDFRQGWQEGIDQSIQMGLYRQPYCGCIYSEQERYDKRWQKRQKQVAQSAV